MHQFVYVPMDIMMTDLSVHHVTTNVRLVPPDLHVPPVLQMTEFLMTQLVIAHLDIMTKVK